MRESYIKFLICFFIIYNFLFNLTSQVLPTKRVIDGIYSINDDFVNMYIIEKNGKYIVVDAGNNIKSIERGIKKLKIDIKEIKAVFLTHVDSDHVAAINIFKNAKIFISKEEALLMKGIIYRKYSKNIECNYEVLNDGEVINIEYFEIKCILTPGHTTGTMCYLIDDIYLFTGDTIGLKNGRAETFMKIYNMDTEMQKDSIKKLIKFPFVKYVFTAHHGFSDNYKKSFEKIK